MTRQQKIVAAGAAGGIAVMLAALFALPLRMPWLRAGADAGERIAYASQWIGLAAAPLFISIAAVGNGCFKSEAIDPTLGKESRETIVNGRVADNMLQQYAMFFAAALAIAAGATGEELSPRVQVNPLAVGVTGLALYLGFVLLARLAELLGMTGRC